MLAGLFGEAENHRIRLCETLETFDELGELLGIHGLDGYTHNGRDAEFYTLHGVGGFVGGNGTSLEGESVKEYEFVKNVFDITRFSAFTLIK